MNSLILRASISNGRLDIQACGRRIPGFSDVNPLIAKESRKGIRAYSSFVGKILAFFGKAIAISAGPEKIYLNINSLLNRVSSIKGLDRETTRTEFEKDRTFFMASFFGRMKEVQTRLKNIALGKGLVAGSDALNRAIADCVDPCLVDSSIHTLKEFAHIDMTDENGKTALHHVCSVETPNIESIQKLIDSGADVNAIDQDGKTALHWACLHGNLAAIKSLIEHGASVHVKNRRGETPLHKSCSSGISELIPQYLVSKGANLTARDKDGNQPLHIARQQGNLRVAKYLMSSPGVDKNASNKAGERPIHKS